MEGTGAVGQQLTCKPEHWNGAPPPAFTYKWLRSGTKEVVGSGATYTVEEADRLHKLSCEVTGENAYGKATAKSSNEVEVPGTPPSNTELAENRRRPAGGKQIDLRTGQMVRRSEPRNSSTSGFGTARRSVSRRKKPTKS